MFKNEFEFFWTFKILQSGSKKKRKQKMNQLHHINWFYSPSKAFWVASYEGTHKHQGAAIFEKGLNFGTMISLVNMKIIISKAYNPQIICKLDYITHFFKLWNKKGNKNNDDDQLDRGGET